MSRGRRGGAAASPLREAPAKRWSRCVGRRPSSRDASPRRRAPNWRLRGRASARGAPTLAQVVADRRPALGAGARLAPSRVLEQAHRRGLRRRGPPSHAAPFPRACEVRRLRRRSSRPRARVRPTASMSQAHGGRRRRARRPRRSRGRAPLSAPKWLRDLGPRDARARTPQARRPWRRRRGTRSAAIGSEQDRRRAARSRTAAARDAARRRGAKSRPAFDLAGKPARTGRTRNAGSRR